MFNLVINSDAPRSILNCVCACSKSESVSPRCSNTVLVENREGEMLLTAELDTKNTSLSDHYLWQSFDMRISFIGLNSPCHFSHPFCVPSEFFKVRMGSVVTEVWQMLSEASTVIVAGQPNSSAANTPYHCRRPSAKLPSSRYLTVAKLLNTSAEYR